MDPRQWKLIAGGAALAGIAAGGIAGASSGPLGLNDSRPVIALSEPVAAEDDAFIQALVDASPESADSPNESVGESADSPFDSPDDAAWVDASPESADSPNESVGESADSPFDSPDDAEWVDPSLEPVDSPNDSPQDSPEPAPAAPAGADDSGASWSVDSPDSADSD
jgi:hypothetical protein